VSAPARNGRGRQLEALPYEGETAPEQTEEEAIPSEEEEESSEDTISWSNGVAVAGKRGCDSVERASDHALEQYVRESKHGNGWAEGDSSEGTDGRRWSAFDGRGSTGAGH